MWKTETRSGVRGGLDAGKRKWGLRMLRGSDLPLLECKATILPIVDMNGNREIRVTH